MKFFYNASAMQRAFGTLMLSLAQAMQKFRSNITKTLILGVKLAAVFILITCLQVSAKTANAQKLSLSFKNGSLEKLFAEIEKRTNYVFFYDVAILKGTRPVTVEVKDASVEDILATSLKGQMLEYSIHDRTIFVKKGAEVRSADVPLTNTNGQMSFITGLVHSENGVPLAGATVFIKKLKKTGMTNDKGEFTVKDVPDGEYEVEITSIGYEPYLTKISVVGQEATLVASMKQAVVGMDEMVFKGYYNTSKRLNTGDVSTVKADVIQKQPVTDPLAALEGRVPGLYISQSGSGLPGTAFTVRLMGRNSISNGNDPLYIVDGVPFGSTSLSLVNTGGTSLSPFNNLSTSDIESIEVLKDADATAIYGSRGANGVILITTKKGKAGKTRVDINVARGANSIARKIALLNTQEYLQMRHMAFQNDGATPGAQDYDLNGTWDTTRYTNWQKVLLGNPANFTNAQASFSGGNSNTQFILSGTFSRQGTNLPGNFYDQKGAAHFSLSNSSADRKFQLFTSISYVNDNNFLPAANISNYVLGTPDSPPIYDQNGNLNWANGTWTNPFAILQQTVKGITDNIIGNLNLSYELLPGLKLSANVGGNYIQSVQTKITPLTYSNPATATSSSRQSYFGTSNSKSWIFEPQLNYARSLGRGKLDLLIGSTLQENAATTNSVTGTNFASDALLGDVAAAASFSGIIYSKNLYHYSAAFARIGYNYEEKYILNLTARRDGSSRFGPGNQFGNFGAVGAGWIFSKERFFEDHVPFLSFGKLRASYGTAGNDQITAYKYLSTYSPYGFSYQNIAGLYPTSLSNPYFGWELDKKLNGGVELGFLKDRILISGSYFRNRTANQLVGYSLPTITGFSSVTANLPAVVQNTGFEFTLNTINVQSKNLKWTSSLNLTIPRNKLVSYPNLAGSSYATTYVVGKSLFVQQLYHYTGLDANTGLYTFEDVNHDGKITSPQDLTARRTLTQDYYGGIENSLAYKGIQLDFFFQVVKQTGTNYLTSFNRPGGFYANNNQPTFILNNSSLEKFTQTFNSPLAPAFVLLLNSDAKIQDASFIRLKNVSLSYQLPTIWLQKVHFQNIKIYIQSQNLLTITQYRGMDPENQGYIPPTRTVTAGIAVGL